MAPKWPPLALFDGSLSSLKTFIDAQGELGPTLRVSCTVFRNAFNSGHTGKPVSHGLAEAMRQLGFFTHKVKHGANHKPTEVYFGIGLKDATSEGAQPLVTSREELAPEDLAVVLSGSDYGEFNGFRVRKTDGSPPLVSIIDLIRSTTGAANPRFA